MLPRLYLAPPSLASHPIPTPLASPLSSPEQQASSLGGDQRIYQIPHALFAAATEPERVLLAQACERRNDILSIYAKARESHRLIRASMDASELGIRAIHKEVLLAGDALDTCIEETVKKYSTAGVAHDDLEEPWFVPRDVKVVCPEVDVD